MRLLLFLGLFLFGTSFAHSQKSGYIDSDYILNKMPEYTEAKAKLDKMADRWTEEIEKMYQVLQQKKDDFAREEALLPKEEMKKRQEEIDKLENEAIQLQTLRFGVKGSYFEKRQELIKPIQDKVFDAMQKIASQRKFTFVFDKANQSNLVYADPKMDISDMVLRELGVNK